MIGRLGDPDRFEVEASDGKIGNLSDVYVDDCDWCVRYLVIDIGDWISDRKVLISPEEIDDMDWHNEKLKLNVSKKKVEESPEAEAERPVSKKHLVALHNYYGWSAYWPGGMPAGPPPTGIPPPTPSEVGEVGSENLGDEEEPMHLRSAEEIMGYHIHATDGRIGHLEDLLIEDEENVPENRWMVRYFIVNTRDWLPGRDVIVSPDWIEDIDWLSSHIGVDVSKEDIKNSPEYNPEEELTRDYEVILYENLDKTGYWL